MVDWTEFTRTRLGKLVLNPPCCQSSRAATRWNPNAQNRRRRSRLIVKPCFAALVQVNPAVRETHVIAPIRLLAPYASLGPTLSAVSPAQTYRARPTRSSESPWPQSSRHDPGFAGGDQLRVRISHRIAFPDPAVSPTHPMLPDGVRNPTSLAEAVEATVSETMTIASASRGTTAAGYAKSYRCHRPMVCSLWEEA